MYKAKDVESKVKLLRELCFPSSLEVNLLDIKRYTYFQKILQNKMIEKREILRVISYMEKNKISDFNEILNRII